MNRMRKNDEWFIRQITVGEAALEDHQIRQMAREMEIPFQNCGYFCVVIGFAGDGLPPQALYETAMAVGRTLKNDVFGYIYTHESLLLMLSEENDRTKVVEKLYRGLSKRLGRPVKLGVGRSYRDLGKLSYSRVEAIEALRESSSGICYVDDLYVSRHFTTRKLESQRRRIIELFKNGQLDQMEQNMEKLAENVRSESPVRADAPYPTSIRRTILEVLFEIMHIGSDAGVDVDKLMDYQDPYSRVFEIGGPTPELLRWLGDIAKSIHEAMSERRSKAQHTMLERAKICIEAHISDPELSLSLISEELEITPTYFSAFFIREMGMGFHEYVTGLRIERAKELLEQTNEKIGQIAQACGFRSASYFTVVFRKQLGISPNEYRNKK